MARLRLRLVMAASLALAGWNAAGAQECPRLLGNFNMPAGTACGMTLVKNVGYIPEGSDVFQVLDLTDARRIKALWTHSWASLCPTQTLLEGSAMAGRLVYITFRCLPDATLSPGPTGLLILDVASPGAPVEQPRLELTLPATGGFTSVAVDGATAYAAAGTQGLYIFDISDPLNPALLSQLDTDGYAESLAVKPGYVFLVDRSLYGGDGEGVVAVSVSNPSAPRRIGAFIGAKDPRRVVLDGYKAYVSDSGAPTDGEGAGMWILDISMPTTPLVMGFYASSMRSLGLAVDGNLAYLGLYADDAYSSRLQVVDATSPSRIFSAGYFQTFGMTSGLSRNSNAVYFGTAHVLKAFDTSACHAPHHGRPVTKP